jgi:AraC-like DNA-binding protein
MTEEISYTHYSIPVPEAFEEVFSHFYYAKNTTGNVLTRTLLPSFQTIMVFSFKAGLSLVSKQRIQIPVDKCTVIGPIKQAFTYALQPGAEMLVVNFKDDAFYRFFGTAVLSETIPLHPDRLIGDNCFNRLWYILHEQDTAQMTATLLDFCKPYLKVRDELSERLAHFKDDAQSPIKTLSQELRQSERTLQSRHKKHFGYTAKEKTRYRRFINAINYLHSHPGSTDWFDIISEFGYYDQSQLIHDFKHYLNLSPGQYLKFQQDICRSGN